MTRTEIADTITLALGYNDTSRKPDRRLIYAEMDLHLPQILVMAGKIDGKEILDNFNISKEVPTYYNTSRAKWALKLPSKPMNLNGKAGIRQIGSLQEEGDAFVPIQSGYNAIISNMEVAGLGGRKGYYLEGLEVLFKNPPIPMPSKVLVRYVPSIRSLSDSDEVTCPAEVLTFLSDKLMQVLTVQKNTNENRVDNSKNNQ